MTRTAIIAAMPAELKHIVPGWKPSKQDGVSLWAHRDENLWVAACAGAGQSAATRAFAAIEKDAPIDLVFSIGWAGALRADLAPGTAHNLAGVIDARTGERFKCDAGAGALWLATSPIVANEAEKLRLAATTYNAASSTWKPPLSPASPRCAASPSTASRASATRSTPSCPISTPSSPQTANSAPYRSLFMRSSVPALARTRQDGRK